MRAWQGEEGMFLCTRRLERRTVVIRESPKKGGRSI